MTTPSATPSATRPTTLRDRAATGLMLLAALGALYAFIASLGDVLAAGPATQQVETWRMVGFTLFTGLFVLLGWWPRRYPGLWELVILNKAALTLVEALLIQNHAVNAQATALADGILTLVLVAAYLLSRGYTSWTAPRPRG